MERITALGSRTFASLRIRNFRLYFIGLCISLSGTWMQTVALGWLALEISNSGVQLGIIVAFQFLPILILGTWAGVIIDRLDVRRILYWTQLIFFGISLVISALVYFNLMQAWMLYVFALALGFVRLFDNPCRQTFVFELVGNEHVKNAISLNSTANNLARIIGPSIAGILIAGIGTAFCFLINGLSCLALVVALHMMDKKDLYLGVTLPKRAGQLQEGLRYVAGNPLIRHTLIVMAIIGAFAYEFQVSLPLLAKVTFGSGASGYAALLAAMGIGSVIGGLYAASRHKIVPHHLAAFSGAFALSIIATSIMPTLDLAIVGMVCVGFFSINVTSLANTMIQLESAPEMRGRVMSLWSIAMIGSTPIGGPIVGYIGQYFGARWGLGIGGVATLLAIAPAMHEFLKQRVFWRQEDEIEHEAGAVNVKLQ